MFSANAYSIRMASDDDADALRGLAERNGQPPLAGPVLVGELRGGGCAALSLSDGRVIADSGPGSGHVVANLRTRAVGIWAHAGARSLRDRLWAGLPAWYQASATPVAPAPVAEVVEYEAAERQPALIEA